MSEGAKFSIFTLFKLFEIRRAELCLVFIRMIEFFNTVMCFITTISIRALLMILNVPTFF